MRRGPRGLQHLIRSHAHVYGVGLAYMAGAPDARAARACAGDKCDAWGHCAGWDEPPDGRLPIGLTGRVGGATVKSRGLGGVAPGA